MLVFTSSVSLPIRCPHPTLKCSLLPAQGPPGAWVPPPPELLRSRCFPVNWGCESWVNTKCSGQKLNQIRRGNSTEKNVCMIYNCQKKVSFFMPVKSAAKKFVIVALCGVLIGHRFCSFLIRLCCLPFNNQLPLLLIADRFANVIYKGNYLKDLG